MLTPEEITATRLELNQNYQVLAYPEEKVCQQTHLTPARLERVLTMQQPDPSDVWTLRDYLEDMLRREKKPFTPFTRLGDHKNNRWFAYATPWRTEKSQRPQG